MQEEQTRELEEKKPKKKDNSFLKDLIKDIIIAIIIVIAITLVIKPTIVKETSMLYTLQENNYLIVNKLAYLGKEHPDRGDIIVFRSELSKGDRENILLIKRVIGVEGDTIEFRDDQVFRNGTLLKEDYLYGEKPERRCYPDGETFTVGKDEVFAMGDHRSVSRDSRDPSVGNVSEDKILGKAFLRMYPFDRIGLL